MNKEAALSQVSGARERLARAEEAFRRSIEDAHKEGASMRAIATAADLSHQRVHQLVRGSDERRRLGVT